MGVFLSPALRLTVLGAGLFLSGCGCRPGCQTGEFCDVYGQCVANSQPGHPPTGGHSYGMITTKIASGDSCMCDNKEFWLSVVGSGSIRATIQTIYRYRDTEQSQPPPLYTPVEASSDAPAFLGCDSYGTDTDKTCGALTEQFSIVSPSIGIASADIGISTAKDKFLDAHFSCSAVCQPSSTDDCEVIPGGAAGRDIIRKFNALRALAKQSPSTIKKEDVTKIFGIDDDPCLRHDTIIKDGTATNDGESCAVHANFSVSSLPFSAIEMSLLVPATTHGEVSKDFAAIYFTDQAVSPVLTLSNAHLQSLWGGPIKSIEVAPDEMFVLTHVGCIGLTEN